MPVVHDTPAAPPELQVRYVVKSSLVMELVWALMIHEGEPDPERYPARAKRFLAAPGLEDRIAAFWADGDPCFTELFIVAERADSIYESDPEHLWAALEAGTTAEPGREEMSSETPADRARYKQRLARLRDDPEVRAGWLQLIKDVWAAVAEQWGREGRPAVGAYEWELRGKFARSRSYSDLEALLKCDFEGMLPRCVREYSAAGRPVVMVGSWFARKTFVMALDGCLLVGHIAPSGWVGPTAETRNRARRFKALGDPTRLAILESTARYPKTVGELAGEMGVAQPTVSNHVRILRDGGLIRPLDDEPRRLEPDSDALKCLAEELLRAASPGGDRYVTGLDSK
ncbi:MAG TPA: metalloregulator ArsR/SmtB family transcription factor [Acidimicrobiales bacterium]|nr:metalloregulator ArsR/SmtB family transcription factor [Acidimicrobiales bacterium]